MNAWQRKLVRAGFRAIDLIAVVTAIHVLSDKVAAIRQIQLLATFAGLIVFGIIVFALFWYMPLVLYTGLIRWLCRDVLRIDERLGWWPITLALLLPDAFLALGYLVYIGLGQTFFQTQVVLSAVLAIILIPMCFLAFVSIPAFVGAIFVAVISRFSDIGEDDKAAFAAPAVGAGILTVCIVVAGALDRTPSGKAELSSITLVGDAVLATAYYFAKENLLSKLRKAAEEQA